MFLVRGVTPSTAPVTATITTPGETAAPVESSAARKAAAAATTAHAGNVGALGRDLDVATLEDALVKHQCLGDKAGLRKLNVGVPD